jgi:hypothetical protein
MELFFRLGVAARFEILAVEKSDLYEWNLRNGTKFIHPSRNLRQYAQLKLTFNSTD